MAKKKPTQNQENNAPAMEDSVMLKNLKDLNSVLLKETTERREEVESLLKSKGSLELALTRSEMERNSMASELTQLLDRVTEMEMEKDVVFVFVSVEVKKRLEVVQEEKYEIEGKLRDLEREMGEIEKVCEERDCFKSELGVRIEETNGLRLKLAEVERRERKIMEEMEKFKVEYNCLIEERDEGNLQIEAVKKEKFSTEKCLEESNRVADELNREIAKMKRAIGEIEEQRRVDVKEKTDLENRVAEMNVLLQNLGKEEKTLRASLADLESKEGKRAEVEESMARDIERLMRENKERGTNIKGLIEEKSKIEISLNDALKRINEQTLKINVLVKEKNETEVAKVRAEGESVKFDREVGKLKAVISSIEAENEKKTEENRGLSLEINRNKDEIARVTSERDDARKGFEEERENCVILNLKVSEMGKKFDESNKALAKVESENRSVLGEKKELEGKLDSLKSKVASLEGTLLKGDKEINDLKATLLRSDANLGYVLKMVKGARKGDVGIDEGEYMGEEVKPCVDEVMTIRREIREGEAKVEEMKKQVEMLNNSVEEAHKKKNFWTVVSSATTFLAAASVASAAAYVARTH